jgi:hypothetical protein
VYAGTEATRWIVDYAFMQLDIHRISLEVLGDNLGAIAMYKKRYVTNMWSLAYLTVIIAGSWKEVEHARLTFRTGSGGTRFI